MSSVFRAQRVRTMCGTVEAKPGSSRRSTIAQWSSRNHSCTAIKVHILANTWCMNLLTFQGRLQEPKPSSAAQRRPLLPKQSGRAAMADLLYLQASNRLTGTYQNNTGYTARYLQSSKTLIRRGIKSWQSRSRDGNVIGPNQQENQLIQRPFERLPHDCSPDATRSRKSLQGVSREDQKPGRK